MKVLVISPSEIAKDPRVRRHVEVAKEFGEVTTCGFGNEPLPGCKHLVVAPTSRILSKNLVSLILIQLGFHQTAARRTSFYQNVREEIASRREDFDVVVVNDVHALQIALDMFPENNIWADMHEYAPMEGDHDWRWKIAFKRHVMSQCRRHLVKVRVVTSVGRNICTQYERDLQRGVLLIRNTSKYYERIERASQDKKVDDYKHLVHVGVAIRARELENMVFAAAEVPQVFLHLFLLPTETSYYEELVTLCSSIDNVEIEETVPVDQIVPHIAQFDAGVIAIPPTSFNYENGLPNKLFQYIQGRLPVITGPLVEIAEIVNGEGIGIVTANFRSESIADTYREFVSLDEGIFDDALDVAALKYSEDNENEIRRSIFSLIAGYDPIDEAD